MYTVYIYITGTSGYSRKRGDISLPFNVSFPREASKRPCRSLLPFSGTIEGNLGELCRSMWTVATWMSLSPTSKAPTSWLTPYTQWS